MFNCHPQSGIRYGVMSTNNLNPYLVEELFHGPGAVDIDYQAAYEEAKKQAVSDYANMVEEAQIAAAETGADRDLDFDWDEFVENWFERKNKSSDEEQFVEDELEYFSDCCLIDEPTIEGVYEGVTYRLCTLGGAYLLWVIEGPVGSCRSLCSPCVPNAGDLDSGQAPDDSLNYPCYVVPNDWLNLKED